MRISSIVQDLFLELVPAGGQGTARRNAWAAMSAGAVRARQSRDADAAMAAAQLGARAHRSTGA